MGHCTPTDHIVEKMIAVAFALPKVRTVLGVFLGAFGIEVLQKAKHDDLTYLEFARFSRQKYFVARYIGQYPLVVFGQYGLC